MKMQDNQKLAPSEIQKIKFFIAQYSDMYAKVEDLNNRVGNIDKEKTDIAMDISKIAEALEVLRIEETDFQQMLIAKYGDFHLNVETFEIKPHIK